MFSLTFFDVELLCLGISECEVSFPRLDHARTIRKVCNPVTVDFPFYLDMHLQLLRAWDPMGTKLSAT